MTERDIFIGAVQRGDSGERRAYLDAACAGDAGLRARVEGLLAVYDRAGSFLEPPPPDAGPEASGPGPRPETATSAPDGPTPTGAYDPPPAEAGAVIAGRYKLAEEIGEG